MGSMRPEFHEPVSLTGTCHAAFIEVNPPETLTTDITLSQFLAIQEKGVSAWEFEPELEIANCFVEARTEIEFFDSECCVQSNLPIPKQNEVYYFEAKVYDKPDPTLISIGVATKPYPLFRLPGMITASCSPLPETNVFSLFRLPSPLPCLPLHRPSKTQPAFLSDPIRASLHHRGRHRGGLSSSNRNHILHAQWQEARGRRPWHENPKLLPHNRSQRTMQCTCQLWSKWLCLHRGECQKMGVGADDRKFGTATAVRK